MLQEAGHEIVGYRLVKNNAQQITQALTHMLASRARFVMLTGGTGPGHTGISRSRPCNPCWRKELTGFGELFRILSYEEIGAADDPEPRPLPVRIGNKFVVCCPGSSSGARASGAERDTHSRNWRTFSVK